MASVEIAKRVGDGGGGGGVLTLGRVGLVGVSEPLHEAKEAMAVNASTNLCSMELGVGAAYLSLDGRNLPFSHPVAQALALTVLEEFSYRQSSTPRRTAGFSTAGALNPDFFVPIFHVLWFGSLNGMVDSCDVRRVMHPPSRVFTSS
jgi:hypothetical protein